MSQRVDRVEGAQIITKAVQVLPADVATAQRPDKKRNGTGNKNWF